MPAALRAAWGDNGAATRKVTAPLDRAAEGAIAAWNELALKAVPWMCVKARVIQIRRF